MVMKCLFVYNPNSGKGKIVKKEEYIINKLREKYDVVDVIRTQYPNHAKEIAETLAFNYDTLVISGGDGTLNEVINGLAEKENAPIIGYIPTGTVNDIAHSLHISTNIKKAVKIILKGKVFNHDIFKVNNKYGMYVCATGLFTQASYSTQQEKKKNWGSLAYYFDAVPRIFKTEPIEVELHYGNTKLYKNCSIFLAINSRYVGGQKVNPHAELDDGYVDVVMVESPRRKKFSIIGLFSTLKLFIFGINYSKNRKGFTYLKLKDFDVKIRNKTTTINLDGEGVKEEKFKFKAIEKGVKIFVK